MVSVVFAVFLFCVTALEWGLLRIRDVYRRQMRIQDLLKSSPRFKLSPTRSDMPGVSRQGDRFHCNNLVTLLGLLSIVHNYSINNNDITTI